MITIKDYLNVLEPGTVISVNIADYNGESKRALFLVIYDEQRDNNIIGNNVIGLKITSKNTCVNSYVVKVDRRLNSFFNKDCMICCNNLMKLTKNYNVNKVIGTIDRTTLKNVYKIYKKFSSELEKQILISI